MYSMQQAAAVHNVPVPSAMYSVAPYYAELDASASNNNNSGASEADLLARIAAVHGRAESLASKLSSKTAAAAPAVDNGFYLSSTAASTTATSLVVNPQQMPTALKRVLLLIAPRVNLKCTTHSSLKTVVPSGSHGLVEPPKTRTFDKNTPRLFVIWRAVEQPYVVGSLRPICGVVNILRYLCRAFALPLYDTSANVNPECAAAIDEYLELASKIATMDSKQQSEVVKETDSVLSKSTSGWLCGCGTQGSLADVALAGALVDAQVPVKGAAHVLAWLAKA